MFINRGEHRERRENHKNIHRGDAENAEKLETKMAGMVSVQFDDESILVVRQDGRRE